MKLLEKVAELHNKLIVSEMNQRWHHSVFDGCSTSSCPGYRAVRCSNCRRAGRIMQRDPEGEGDWNRT